MSRIDDLVMTRTQDPDTDLSPLPLSGLLALAAAGFITIMTEALPAGVLPAMSHDLAVTESAAGQAVTVYAIGSAVAAVPLTSATIGWQRRHLLLVAISGFALANTVTAFSTSYPLTMVARFVAGVVAGLLWALLAGYARRMVAPHQRGKAMAIAMAGAPLALSIGVPAGTFLAGLVGWRTTFALMTLLTVILIGWVIATVPNFPGQPADVHLPLRHVIAIPGVAPVLFVTVAFVLAHNILYTYIAPFLAAVRLGHRVDIVLLVFGAASLLSIWLVGIHIDQNLRSLMLASSGLFALAALALAAFATQPWLVFVSAAVWGIAFGGAATLLQTASAEAAGAAGDVAQSLVVTCWNIGIAGGGVLGGVLIGGVGTASLPWVVLGLVMCALAVSAAAHRHGFATRAIRRRRSATQ
jgi:predicted MFS family arabinose efflux permease